MSGTSRVLIKYLDSADTVVSPKIEVTLVGKPAASRPELAPGAPAPAPAESTVLARTVWDHAHTWCVENDVIALSVAHDEKFPDVSVVRVTYAYAANTAGAPKHLEVVPMSGPTPEPYWTGTTPAVTRTPAATAVVKLTFVGDTPHPSHGKSVKRVTTSALTVRIVDDATGAVAYQKSFARTIEWTYGNYLRLSNPTRNSPREIAFRASAMVDSLVGNREPHVSLTLYDKMRRRIATDSADWEFTPRPRIVRFGEWQSGDIGVKYRGTADVSIGRIDVTLDLPDRTVLAKRSLNVDMLWPSTIVGFVPDTATAGRDPLDRQARTLIVKTPDGLIQCRFDEESVLLPARAGKPGPPASSPAEPWDSRINVADVVAVSGQLAAERTSGVRPPSSPMRTVNHATFRYLGTTAVLREENAEQALRAWKKELLRERLDRGLGRRHHDPRVGHRPAPPGRADLA